MIAGIYTLTIEQDGDLYLLLYLEDEAGVAVDLTDCEAEAYIVRTPGAATKLAVFSSETPGEGEDEFDGTITLGGSAGTLQLDMAQAVADNLPAGKWYWYLYVDGLAELGGGRRRLLEGPCVVSQAAGVAPEPEPEPAP